MQTLDFLKVVLMSGGAGLGTFLTILRTDVIPKKKNEKPKR